MPSPTPLAERTTTVLFDLDDTLFGHTATSRAARAANTATLPFLRGVDLELLCRRYSD